MFALVYEVNMITRQYLGVVVGIGKPKKIQF